MFYGNQWGEFNERDQALIAAVERQEPQGIRGMPQPRQRVADAPGAGTVVMGLFIAAIVAAGLVEAVRGIAAQEQGEAMQNAKIEVQRSIQSQVEGNLQDGQRAVRPVDPTQGLVEEEAIQPSFPNDSLPVGWRFAYIGGDMALLDYPATDARVLMRMPRNTQVLFRQMPGSDPCWHMVILADAHDWGYACIGLQGAGDDPAWSLLPPDWERVVYIASLPAALSSPAGQLLPETEVVIRRVRNTNTYFVMSIDGTNFGYGVFRADAFASVF